MGGLQSIWIDTDVSIGLEHFPGLYRDIDDALALVSIFNSKLVSLRGISSTFANTNADKSYKIAKQLAERFGPKGLRVFKGCATPIKGDALPDSEAVWALADALREKPMTIVSLGAATNIAVLIARHPELVDRIEGIVAMAGARRTPDEQFIVGPRQLKPFRALNFESDVDAWRIILASNVPVTFAPFELSHKVWITEADIKLMEHGAGESGAWLAPYMRKWAREWTELYGSPGFNPFDALATGYVLAPDMFEGDSLPAGILEPGQCGPDHNAPCLIASDSLGDARRVTFLHDVNQGFKSYLLDTLRGGMRMSTHVLAVSHINVVVDDIEKATEFYERTLGFQMAYNADGAIDFPGYRSPAFARDAGFLDGRVDVDVRFLRHPQAGFYLELMRYNDPKGSQDVIARKTNDMGGPRHIAVEVADICAVFEHLKGQPDVTMINPSPEYGPPEKLGQSDISFFYWLDPYGVQWEMEQGRPIGYGREIAG